MLHRNIPCNLYLSKFCDKDEICSECNQKEDILHMLFNCTFLTDIWNIVSLYFETAINEKDILCGWKNKTVNENMLLDYIIYYIFLYKYLTNCKLSCEKNITLYLKHKLNYLARLYHDIDKDFVVIIDRIIRLFS